MSGKLEKLKIKKTRAVVNFAFLHNIVIYTLTFEHIIFVSDIIEFLKYVGESFHMSSPVFSSSRIVKWSNCSEHERDQFTRFFAENNVSVSLQPTTNLLLPSSFSFD